MKCIDNDRVITDRIDRGEAPVITIDRDDLWNALYEARIALKETSYQYSETTRNELQDYAELLLYLRTSIVLSRYTTVVINFK